MATVVIFGGSGFIGTHFAQYLLDNNIATHVVLADLIPVADHHRSASVAAYMQQDKIVYHFCDVRKPISLPCKSASLIANFAAVHREPGHQPVEYFETNIQGAEQVCAWASAIDCNAVIFTSSIAPYGPSETARDELSIPVPETAYGSSKLCAEKIHIGWQGQRPEVRKLVIVRPGVVFGAGEGGNVSRLIKAVLKGYFFYMGNKDTRKAGVYVKELCHAMCWVLDRLTAGGVILFNMSMNPAPSIAEYVNVICATQGVRRFIPAVPYRMLYAVAFFIDAFASVMHISQPISPVRIRKLVRSNHIVAQYLQNSDYRYIYTLQTAMQDWKKDCPQEW